MEIYVLTSCVSGSGICSPVCEVFCDEQSAKAAMKRQIDDSIRECAEKYGINPDNIEPRNDQGAVIAQICGGTYAWKVKKAEAVLDADNEIFILLHAHNRGYVFYAESHVFSDMDAASAAMKSSYKSALDIWRLIQGKTSFEDVKASITEEDGRIQLGGAVEVWRIVKRQVQEQKI